jgi:transposase
LRLPVSRCRRTARLSGRADKLLFIATLGWSRASYVEFCDYEHVETLIQARENARLAFGDGPIGVVYDNARAVVERNALWPRRKSGTEGDEMHFALWVFPS